MLNFRRPLTACGVPYGRDSRRKTLDSRNSLDPDKYLLTPISQPTLHFCREQYEDARRLYRAQVEHWEAQAKRQNNIDIGQLQMKLALAEARADHFEEAIDAYERAASAFERDWCPGHPKALAASVAKAALEASVKPRV